MMLIQEGQVQLLSAGHWQPDHCVVGIGALKTSIKSLLHSYEREHDEDRLEGLDRTQ